MLPARHESTSGSESHPPCSRYDPPSESARQSSGDATETFTETLSALGDRSAAPAASCAPVMSDSWVKTVIGRCCRPEFAGRGPGLLARAIIGHAASASNATRTIVATDTGLRLHAEIRRRLRSEPLPRLVHVGLLQTADSSQGETWRLGTRTHLP